VWRLYGASPFDEVPNYPAIGKRLLYFERAVNLSNGVSPLVPILLLAAVTGCWLYCQLRRFYYAQRFWEDYSVKVPPGPASSRLELIEKYRETIKQLTLTVLPRGFFSNIPVLFTCGMMALVLFRLFHRTIPSVDFGYWTFVPISVIWFLALTVVISLFRFLFLWHAIDEMLHLYISLPVLRALDRVPAAFSRTFGRYLGEFRLKRLSLSIPVHQWIVVARGFDDVKPQISQLMFGKTDKLDDKDTKIFERIERSIKGVDDSGELRSSSDAVAAIRETFFTDTSLAKAGKSDDVANCKTWRGFRFAAVDCLYVLVPFWRATSLDGQFGEPQHDENKERTAGTAGGTPTPDGPKSTSADTQPADRGPKEEERNASAPQAQGGGVDPVDDRLPRWMREAEDLLALRMVTFISQGAVHLRNLATYLVIAPVLLLLTVSSYPFQPQRFLVIFIWVILLAVVGAGVTVLVLMERNEFLSRVSHTKPNNIALDRTFITNLLAFLLPLVVAALNQFQFVSDTFIQWFQPILRVLK
jgi:hypothetical protein